MPKYHLIFNREDKNTYYQDIYKKIKKDFLLLEELLVEPQHMGKGYGKQGFKKVLSIAREQKIPLVFQPFPLRVGYKDYCGNQEVDLFNKREVEKAVNSLLEGFYIPILKKEGYRYEIKKIGEFNFLTVVVYL